MPASLRAFAASALLAASTAGCVGAAMAAPGIDHLTFKNGLPNTIEFAQWRGGWGYGWGAPAAGGFVAGALLGGALAAPYYYAPGPYYYPSPYYPPAPAGYYAPGPSSEPGEDPVAYCAQRFRSYNPKTGLYIGTDRRLHPCP